MNITTENIINCLGTGGGDPTVPKFGQEAPNTVSENAVPGGSVDPGEAETPAEPLVRDPVVQRANDLIRALSLVLKHHNAPQAVQDSLRCQLLAYLARDGDVPVAERVYAKRAKYVTCAPMSWYLKKGCEPLKAPPHVWEPEGQFKRWAQRRLWDRSTKNTHLWYSWLQGKRAASPLTNDMVLLAYEEHRVAMELPDPIDADTREGVMTELEPRLAYIADRLMKSYLPATLEEHLESYQDLDGDTLHVASTRACYESSRKDGGQLGYLNEKLIQGGGPSTLTGTGVELGWISWHPQVLIDGVVTNNVLIEHYHDPIGELEWRNGLHQEALFYRGQILRATIQVVLEPLKTRVISKGEAVPYYLSKPLQRKLHDILRELPEFRLIGRPLVATDLMDLEVDRVVGGEGRYEWFSIDYSAATDGLSASLSAAIMERILRPQRSDLREIWMKVLAPHFCEYPAVENGEGKKVRVPPVQQVNGQLMGSILSFPILCLANLGLYLFNIRDDPRPLAKKLSGVLVNGDDMLYVARRSRWSTHVQHGERVGLHMSPGKAYHDDVFANANSACFHFALQQPEEEWADGTLVYPFAWDGRSRRTPKAVPFLNAGLYFGQNKVQNKVSSDDGGVQSLVSIIPELLKGCRPGVPSRKREIYAGYLKKHRVAIAEEAGDRNLFISTGLGGMGLTQDPDLKCYVTLAQRQEAFRLYSAQPNGHIGFGPLPGREVREAPVPWREPWLVPSAKKRDPPRFRYRAGAPMLSTHLCLQPFRVCDVSRRRPAGLVINRGTTTEWDEIDPTAITLEACPRSVPVERPYVRPARAALEAARAGEFIDDLVWHDPECLGFESERYHHWCDTYQWIAAPVVPELDECDNWLCDCRWSPWSTSVCYGNVRQRPTSNLDPDEIDEIRHIRDESKHAAATWRAGYRYETGSSCIVDVPQPDRWAMVTC